MKIRVVMLSVLIGFAQAAVAVNKIQVQDGKWEVIAQMEIPGIPVKVPPTKHTQCITEKDLVPKQMQQRDNCTFFDMHVSASTVNWSMECQTPAGQMKGKGKAVYKKTTFNGSFQMEMPGPQGSMRMTTRMNGRYIGPCQ